VNRFQPMIEPTMAWVVDAGSLFLLNAKTVIAAQMATVKAPAMASTVPSFPNVSVVPEPCTTAPRIMKMLAMVAAVLKRNIFDPTAVPKMLAASFEPNDQPRNNPPVRKNKNTAIDRVKLYV